MAGPGERWERDYERIPGNLGDNGFVRRYIFQNLPKCTLDIYMYMYFYYINYSSKLFLKPLGVIKKFLSKVSVIISNIKYVSVLQVFLNAYISSYSTEINLSFQHAFWARNSKIYKQISKSKLDLTIMYGNYF